MDVRLWLLFCDFSEDDFDFLDHKITNPEYAPPHPALIYNVYTV